MKRKKELASILAECAELAASAHKGTETPETVKSAVLPGNGTKTESWKLFDPRRRRCGYDNGKVGGTVATVSAMPGNEESLNYNAVQSVFEEYKNYIDIYGVRACVSCPVWCPGCYAMKEKRLPAVLETWLLNTIELHCNARKFWELVENELFHGVHAAELTAVRIHESGEFISEKEFNIALEMFARHPEMVFFGYSKQEFVGNAYENGQLPENVRFSCSPWITADGTVLCAPVSDMHQFIYDDGTNPALDSVVHCCCSNPDNTVNKGNTCAACGRCIRAKKGTRTAVHPHGVGLYRSWLAGRFLYYSDNGKDDKTAAALAYRDGMKNCRAWSATVDTDNMDKLIKNLISAGRKARKARTA